MSTKTNDNKGGIIMYRMKGVIPPMITPFQENGDVDYQGLKTLVSFL